MEGNKMTDLITKEELLELGFELRNYDDEIKYMKHLDLSNGRNKLFIKNRVDFKYVILVAYDGYICHETEVYACKATKPNVLKLIEIAKLIGELE